MYFKSSKLILKAKQDKDKILYCLKGITEEDEDKSDIVPSKIYKFIGSVIDDKFDLIPIWSWMITIQLYGQISRKKDISEIFINFKVTKFTLWYTMFIYIFFLTPVIVDGFSFSLVFFIMILWLFFTIANITAILYAKRKIKRIFNKIFSGEFREDKLKYMHKD